MEMVAEAFSADVFSTHLARYSSTDARWSGEIAVSFKVFGVIYHGCFPFFFAISANVDEFDICIYEFIVQKITKLE